MEIFVQAFSFEAFYHLLTMCCKNFTDKCEKFTLFYLIYAKNMMNKTFAGHVYVNKRLAIKMRFVLLL